MYRKTNRRRDSRHTRSHRKCDRSGNVALKRVWSNDVDINDNSTASKYEFSNDLSQVKQNIVKLSSVVEKLSNSVNNNQNYSVSENDSDTSSGNMKPSYQSPTSDCCSIFDPNEASSISFCSHSDRYDDTCVDHVDLMKQPIAVANPCQTHQSRKKNSSHDSDLRSCVNPNNQMAKDAQEDDFVLDCTERNRSHDFGSIAHHSRKKQKAACYPPSYYFPGDVSKFNSGNSTSSDDDSDYCPSTNEEDEDDDSVCSNDTHRSDFGRGLFTKQIQNVVMLYEFPKGRDSQKTYLKEKADYDNRPKCDIGRWKLMDLHIVFPNRDGQICVPVSGEYPHYQVHFCGVTNAIHHYNQFHKSDPIRVSVYYADKNYSNKILYIDNDCKKTTDLVLTPGLLHLLDEEDSADKKYHGCVRRQKLYRDFGITSNVCTSRDSSTTGVSEPMLKPNSTNWFVIALNKEMTKLCSTMKHKGLEIGNFPFDCDDPNNQVAVFLKKKHDGIEGIGVPGTRIALTGNSSEDMVACHSDNQNSRKPNHALTVSVSKLTMVNGKEKRFAAIGYGRKSIDDLEVRRDTHHQYSDVLVQEYKNLPSSFRKVSNRHIRSHPDLTTSRDFGLRVSYMPCHSDPLLASSVVIDGILRLNKALSLTCPERVAIAKAVHVFPECHCQFAIAVHAFVAYRNLIDPEIFRYKFNIGYLFAMFMVEIDTVLKDNNITPKKKYNFYGSKAERKISVRGGKDEPRKSNGFIKDSSAITLIALRSRFDKSTEGKPKNPTLCLKKYESTRKEITKFLSNVDILGGNHLMKVFAIIGIVPFWMIDYIHVNAKGKKSHSASAATESSDTVSLCINSILNDSGFPNSTKICPNDAIAFIQQRLKDEANEDQHSLSKTEHFLCKHYRNHNPYYQKFAGGVPCRDLVVQNQLLFECCSEGGAFAVETNDKRCLLKDAILNKVPFGSELLSPEQLSQKVRSTKLSSLQDLGDDVLEKLYFPTTASRSCVDPVPSQFRNADIESLFNKVLSNCKKELIQSCNVPPECMIK